MFKLLKRDNPLKNKNHNNRNINLKQQIKDINMSYNEIFSIIRIGTYEQYEKSIAGVDIDCFNEYKQNLLQGAIAACKNDIAKDLINRNIDLNHQDSNGQAPLHYCAQYLNIEIARLLLSKNADINIEDAYGNNPLWTAVFNARGDYRMVELFIEYNANIYHLNKARRSPLDFAKQIDDLDMVKILLQER